jgi:small-conductance mechanosensitive channel
MTYISVNLKRSHRTISGLLVHILIVFLLLLSGNDTLHAQGLGGTSTPSITVVQSAFVEFNNAILFPVYTNGSELAQDRADLATARLAAVWAAYDNAKGAVSDSEIHATIQYERFGIAVKVGGVLIIAVSPADTAASGMEDEQLASLWASKINAAFAQIILERSPEYFRWAISHSAIDIVLAASIFIIVLYIGIRFKAQRLWPVYTAIAVTAAHHIANLFPDARSVLLDFSTGPMRPLYIIFIVSVPAAAIARIWSFVMHRIVPPLPEHISAKDLIRRTNLRRRTLAAVAEVTGASIIWIIAGIIALSWFGVSLSSLLTSAGLIGVGLGFVAQDSIRDTLAGIYILADDRYGTGDVIKVGEYEGRVERFNLRMTQIRDMSGRLITLSNRGTTEVANLTARWAQVDFSIGISYYEDINNALSVLEETAAALQTEWPEHFLEKPQLIGVESFNDTNIVIRIIARTPPGDQALVVHELRKRVKFAFDKAGIAMTNELHKSLKPEQSS